MKIQNNTRTLIISPDQKYWDLSKPLLFCGEWCINKNNEELLKEKNYKILNDKVFQKNFNLSQIKFCDQVYENLLKEISLILNKFHGISGVLCQLVGLRLFHSRALLKARHAKVGDNPR